MMTAAMGGGRRVPGRPRSTASRNAILRATHALLETTTVRDLTIEAIAQKAGVGKATIYRWWPSKTAIVIEVLVEMMNSNTPLPKGETCLRVIQKHLSLIVTQYRGRLGRIVAQILAEAQFDAELLAEFHLHFFADRRAAVRGVIEAGIRDGEFPKALDVDAVIDTLYGAINFRLIARHLPLDRRFERSLGEIAATTLRGR